MRGKHGWVGPATRPYMLRKSENCTVLVSEIARRLNIGRTSVRQLLADLFLGK